MTSFLKDLSSKTDMHLDNFLMKNLPLEMLVSDITRKFSVTKRKSLPADSKTN